MSVPRYEKKGEKAEYYAPPLGFSLDLSKASWVAAQLPAPLGVWTGITISEVLLIESQRRIDFVGKAHGVQRCGLCGRVWLVWLVLHCPPFCSAPS